MFEKSLKRTSISQQQRGGMSPFPPLDPPVQKLKNRVLFTPDYADCWKNQKIVDFSHLVPENKNIAKSLFMSNFRKYYDFCKFCNTNRIGKNILYEGHKCWFPVAKDSTNNSDLRFINTGFQTGFDGSHILGTDIFLVRKIRKNRCFFTFLSVFPDSFPDLFWQLAVQSVRPWSYTFIGCWIK